MWVTRSMLLLLRSVSATFIEGMAIQGRGGWRYDKGMSKRRVTLTLDEDLVEAFQQREGRSLSAVVNAALREAIESENHRKAALKWLDELNAKYGKATPEEQAENEAWLDEIGFGKSTDDAAGAA
jgi:uncharacterized protein (DUF4415 family)